MLGALSFTVLELLVLLAHLGVASVLGLESRLDHLTFIGLELLLLFHVFGVGVLLVLDEDLLRDPQPQSDPGAVMVGNLVGGQFLHPDADQDFPAADVDHDAVDLLVLVLSGEQGQ